MAVVLQDLGRKGRARVRGRVGVAAKGHFVVRVGGDFILEHNPVEPWEISNVADICSIAGHNCLRHLADGHVNVVDLYKSTQELQAPDCGPIRAWANPFVAFYGSNPASTCGCIPQRLAATGNMVWSLGGGSQPP